VVKNTSGRPLTVGVRVMPDTPAEGAWFSLQGEAERRLAPEESDQFAVNVRPPAGTAPGPRTFHLLVYDTAAPGEDFSSGPTVAVEVEEPEKPPAPPQKKRFPWWILLVLLVVLGAAAAVIALWPPASTRVPDLTGQTVQEADEALQQASLVRGQTIDKATRRAATSGTVLEQAPPAGEEVEQGTAVDLVVEVPPARLSDVTGRPEAEAKRLLEAQGLKVGRVTRQRSSRVRAGTVIEQDPRGGASFSPGDPVDLIVAEAVPARLMDLTGKTVREARRLLEADGLRVGNITRRPTRQAPTGTVIAQDPGPGAPFESGDTVNLTVAAAVVAPVEPRTQLRGIYTIQQKSNGRYADAHEDRNDNSMVTRDRQNNDTQRWVLTPLGNDTYTIQQKSNGRYVDAHEDVNDNSMVTRTRQNNDTQRWILTPLGNDTYTIQQKSNGRYADAHEDRNDNSMVTRDKQNNDTQRWIIKPL